MITSKMRCIQPNPLKINKFFIDKIVSNSFKLRFCRKNTITTITETKVQISKQNELFCKIKKSPK